MRNLILVLFSLSLLQSCVTNKAAFSGQAFEQHSSSKESGFDQQKLTELTDYIKKNSATTGLLVLSKGKVAYQYGDLE